MDTKQFELVSGYSSINDEWMENWDKRVRKKDIT